MRFVCYDDLDSGAEAQLGIEVFGVVYDLSAVVERVATVSGLPAPPIPATLWAYHAAPDVEKAQLAALIEQLNGFAPDQRRDLMRLNTRRLSPVPQPFSLRCFAGFETHMRLTRERRGLPMPSEWYDRPMFFFGNHGAVYGPGAEVPHPASFWLDFELQLACVIGKAGSNIPAEAAASYIAGYTILNDWCARDLEMYELRMGLGPTKGRDFAVTMGPVLVTPDELAEHVIGDGVQQRFDLRMEASVNGKLVAWGNFRQIHHSFAEMIAHASADVMLYPGDVLASGAVGNGSLLAVGAEESLGRWLQAGDTIDLEVEAIGVLRNTLTLMAP